MTNKINYLNEYIKLLENNYPDSEVLIDAIIKDEYHILWYTSRDYAYRALLKGTSWKSLPSRIDDFSLETTRYMIRQLPKWRWRAAFEVGALYPHLNNAKDTILWIIKRWLSVLKNLFNKKYKNYIKSSYLVEFNESNLIDDCNA